MRYFLISILLHIMAISFCWVGFSVPIGQDQNSFTYLGTSSTIGQISSGGVLPASTKELGGQESAANFIPWLKMRETGKPHVHLGF